MGAEPKRQAAEQRGRKASASPPLFLQAKGYCILDRRVRTPVGEVELIAKRGGIGGNQLITDFNPLEDRIRISIDLGSDTFEDLTMV